MSSKKEKLDQFLKSHILIIESMRRKKGFTWFLVAEMFLNANPSEKAVSTEYVRGRYRLIAPKESYPISTTANVDFKYSQSEDLDKGTSEITAVVNKEIRTLDDLIEVCKIDTSVWNIDKYVANTWGNPLNQQWQVKAFLSKKGKESKPLTEQFTEFLNNYNLKVLNREPQDKIQEFDVSNQMYLISLADLHIGKGQKPSYLEDIKTTIFNSLNAVKEYGVKEIVLLNTGDMLHTDSSKGTTTAGTQLEFSETYENSFTQALNLITDLIDKCKGLALKTTFINVRGNHSFDTEYCLGEAIKKIYSNDKSIQVLNSSENRIYYYWDNNSFLFAHGDKAFDRLPLIFATEGSEYFSKAENRHILLGHMHHSKSKQFINDKGEYNGIEVRVLGSPTATDKWHSQEGFVKSKQCLITMLFTPEQGKFAEFSFKM